MRKIYPQYIPAIQFRWERAQEECSNNNADLASVTSSEENRFINQLAGNATIWIGGNDRETEGTFTWSDGSPWNITKLKEFWAPGEPSNTIQDTPRTYLYLDEDCVEQTESGSRWYDAPCNWEYSFVCKSKRAPGEND